MYCNKSYMNVIPLPLKIDYCTHPFAFDDVR